MKHRIQKGTEGILNKINERYGCNQKRRSVPINNLIKYHAPKQQSELIALIESHQEGHKHSDCPCGCRSAGTLETFADNLYKAYIRFVKEVDNSVEFKDWDDCYIFMKYLFVINSLKGNMMENQVLNHVNEILNQNGYTAKLASEVHDFKYSVDISVFDSNDEEIFGIQVKPLSYKNFEQSHPVIQNNKNKNILYGKNVVYIYYNIDNIIVDKDIIYSDIIKQINKDKSNKIPKLTI